MGVIHRAIKARTDEMLKAQEAAGIPGHSAYFGSSMRAKAAQALYAEMNARNNARLQDLDKLVTKAERKITKGAR